MASFTRAGRKQVLSYQIFIFQNQRKVITLKILLVTLRSFISLLLFHFSLMNEDNDELLQCLDNFETDEDENGLSQDQKIFQTKKTFSCKECSKTFTRNNELLVHIRSSHRNVTYPSSKCGKLFAYKTNRIRHERKCTVSDKRDSQVNVYLFNFMLNLNCTHSCVIVAMSLIVF